MSLPAWPIANTIIRQDDFGQQRLLDPISTDTDDDKTRERLRPATPSR